MIYRADLVDDGELQLTQLDFERERGLGEVAEILLADFISQSLCFNEIAGLSMQFFMQFFDFSREG
ncbi:hypothetical protein BOW51_05995 [Solemya velesiana gill symbiont]|uniref:Uncharacterized protein n=1 Tax=Solemya velesiana gill symbiont TaxID=1918948 RepID=A0A1T2KVD7_9GAMM|nr:hypothetical protein BOW51_05995 [Solemya velesiana gill symbiont]